MFNIEMPDLVDADTDQKQKYGNTEQPVADVEQIFLGNKSDQSICVTCDILSIFICPVTAFPHADAVRTAGINAFAAVSAPIRGICKYSLDKHNASRKKEENGKNEK